MFIILCTSAFEEAEKNAPAIIFIDELDAIAPKRDKVSLWNHPILVLVSIGVCHLCYFRLTVKLNVV